MSEYGVNRHEHSGGRNNLKAFFCEFIMEVDQQKWLYFWAIYPSSFNPNKQVKLQLLDTSLFSRMSKNAWTLKDWAVTRSVSHVVLPTYGGTVKIQTS